MRQRKEREGRGEREEVKMREERGEVMEITYLKKKKKNVVALGKWPFTTQKLTHTKFFS